MLVRIGRAQRLADLCGFHAGREMRECRRVNAARHRREVRNECDRHRDARRESQLLLDFGKVPMFRQAIGAQAPRCTPRRGASRRPSPSAAHARGARHGNAVRLDENPRAAAARAAAECSSGSSPPTPRASPRESPRDAARAGHRRPRQAPPRRMRLTIEFLVNIRVAQPEVRAEIDHAPAGTHERQGELRGKPVREREEKEFRAGREERVDFRVDEMEFRDGGKPGEPRQHVADGLARVGARTHAHDLDSGMAGEQGAQLLAGVPFAPRSRLWFS